MLFRSSAGWRAIRANTHLGARSEIREEMHLVGICERPSSLCQSTGGGGPSSIGQEGTFDTCSNTTIERGCTLHQSSVTSGDSLNGEWDDVSRTRCHFAYAPSGDRGN